MKYYYICYLFILFHEMSHVFVGTLLGSEVEKIKLSMCGVSAKFKTKRYVSRPEKNSLYEVLIYLAGPVSNFIFALIFRNIKIVSEINIFLGLVNLIPIYPLDGFNILKNILEIFKSHKVNIHQISKIMWAVLLCTSVAQILAFRSISMIIFCFYVYLININDSKKNVKI